MAQGDYLGIVMQSDIGAQGANGVAAQSDLQSAAQTATTAKNDIDAIMTSKTIGPTALAGFSDGVDGAILGKCVVNIEPVQSGSGDPSPTNVRPIFGWTRANVSIRQSNNILDTSLKFVGDVTSGGTVIEDFPSGNRFIVPISTKLCSGKTISVSAKNNDWTVVQGPSIRTFYTQEYPKVGVSAYERANDISASNPIKNISGDYNFVCLQFEGILPENVSNFAVYISDTPIPYEPYVGSTYTISFGEAGTVYGGMLDVGTGVLKVDRVKYVPIAVSYEQIENGKRFACGLSSNALVARNSVISNFALQSPANDWSDVGCIAVNRSNVYYVAANELGITTVQEFNDWISQNGFYIVYKLATPQTYQLTPTQIRTLLGLNNIYADCGDVTVQYRGDVPNLYENIAVITEQKKKFYCPPLYQYDGEDFTVKFASEIAQYSDVCAWLKARLAAKDISGIFVKDFFRFTTSNNVTFTARVADINHDLGYGDTEVTKYHIDFICDELWPDNHVWNKVNYNNGIAAEHSPWLCSDLYYFINSLSGNVPNGTGADPATVAVDYTSTGVLDKFPAWMRNAIVERRSLEPTRYKAGALLTDDNSWEWKNIGKLWIPNETELYGQIVWGTRNGYGVGETHQYPLFRDGKMHIKRKPVDGRYNFWCRSVISGHSVYAAAVYYYGYASYQDCTRTWIAPPVCFRIMAN